MSGFAGLALILFIVGPVLKRVSRIQDFPKSIGEYDSTRLAKTADAVLTVIAVLILLGGLVFSVLSVSNRPTNMTHDKAARNAEIQKRIEAPRDPVELRDNWKPPQQTDTERKKEFDDSVDWRKNVQ